MSAVCLDACYLAKLLIEEPDSRLVAGIVAHHDVVACAAHGRAEVATTLHRKLREGAITRKEHDHGMECLMGWVGKGQVRWLPLLDDVFVRVEQVYAASDAKLHLRSADALHLACAVEHGFITIWSSDRQMQAGAKAFGLECRAAGK